jgi:hypothetical protein
MVARATPGITHSPALAPWPDCCTPPTGGASRQSPGCLAGRKHRGLRGHVDMPHGRCGPLLSHWLRPTWQAGGQAASKLFTADPRFPYCRSLPRFGGKKQQQQLDLRRVFPRKGHSTCCITGIRKNGTTAQIRKEHALMQQQGVLIITCDNTPRPAVALPGRGSYGFSSTSTAHSPAHTGGQLCCAVPVVVLVEGSLRARNWGTETPSTKQQHGAAPPADAVPAI